MTGVPLGNTSSVRASTTMLRSVLVSVANKSMPLRTFSLKFCWITDFRSPMSSVKFVRVSLSIVTRPTALTVACLKPLAPSSADSPKTEPAAMTNASASPFSLVEQTTSPSLTKYKLSAGAPSSTMTAPGLYLILSKMLPMASRCSSVSGEKMLTALRNWEAVLIVALFASITICRKVARSSAHSAPAVSHLMVAARSELYMSESSPKVFSPEASYFLTGPSTCLRYALYVPLATT
mmetsp:Transcript_64000/g.142981  ORF Transcript_64000/g.142981 Transcript_64000/m.142981 type:complete len:236 (+) Transcript_64000:2442-3149(+)